MKTPGFFVTLTKNKRVVVKEYEMEQYVSFQQTYEKDGVEYTSYYNLNEEQWQGFLRTLNHIDKVITTNNVVACPDCKDERPIVVVTANGRMKDTLLSPEMMVAVQSNNGMANNQEMLRCEYCGGHSHVSGVGCHCHLHDCIECEQDNFCECCGKLKIFACHY